MTYREATIKDIPGIQQVRNAVRENQLSDPKLVTDEDCEFFITQRGKGWVCQQQEQIVGFAIADVSGQNIWALFILPDFEKKGIGRQLHNIMLDWYFQQGCGHVWLSTAPGTRAEGFYRKMGWVKTGIYGKGEIKFEMTRHQWSTLHADLPHSKPTHEI